MSSDCHAGAAQFSLNQMIPSRRNNSFTLNREKKSHLLHIISFSRAIVVHHILKEIPFTPWHALNVINRCCNEDDIKHKQSGNTVKIKSH